MGQFWLLPAMAAMCIAVVAEPISCPQDCVCSRRAGLKEVIARCSSLNPSQQVFSREVHLLHVSDVPKERAIVLEEDSFKRMGLEQVTTLRIIDSSFQRIHMRAFSSLENLMHLNLSGSDLHLLHPDMFSNNTQLEVLSLRNNELKFMENDQSPFSKYFLNADSLTELDLFNCNLEHLLPNMFTRMTNLNYINLASNGIKVIHPETFAPIGSLSELDLSGNLIGELDSNFFSNGELIKLNLANNPLSSLKGIKIQSLDTLDLSNCKFSVINAETFSGFPELTDLILRGNAINTIDETAFSTLLDLENLDLSHNTLHGPLPENLFANSTYLTKLNLSNNPTLKVLTTRGFNGRFSSLNFLDLSHCGLEVIDANSLRNMDQLSILKLSGNNLKTLQPGIFKPSINVLDLSRNWIKTIDQSVFPVNSQITKLNLKGNPLHNISLQAFSNLQKIQELDLSSCGLYSLRTNNAPEFDHLRYLYLSNNKITYFSKHDLDFVSGLEVLDISQNPIECEDMKVIVNHMAIADVRPLISMKPVDNSLHVIDDGIVTFGGSTRHAWDYILRQVCDEDTDLTYESEPVDFENNINYNVNAEHSSTDAFYTDSENVEQTNTWTIVIATVTSFAVIFSLIILLAVVVACIRQGHIGKPVRKIRTHKAPILRRARSSIYQQLQEHHSVPTTPIMKGKQLQFHNQLVVNNDNIPRNKLEHVIYTEKSAKSTETVPESV